MSQHLTARFLKAFMQAWRSALSACWSWNNNKKERYETCLKKPYGLLSVCFKHVSWPPCVCPVLLAVPGTVPVWWRVCSDWSSEPGCQETMPPWTPCIHQAPHCDAHKWKFLISPHKILELYDLNTKMSCYTCVGWVCGQQTGGWSSRPHTWSLSGASDSRRTLRFSAGSLGVYAHR